MVKNTVFCLSLFVSSSLLGQSFAPAPGKPGTTAISKDSSIIRGWATQIELARGYYDLADKALGRVNYGVPEDALGAAEGNSVNVISLGDSGVAVLQFDRPIMNGPGPDFAVFENGFADDYMEFAFVEVSSDGVNYQRFNAVSEIQDSLQLGPFEYSDCRLVNQLAGKYRQGYGTPFDLADLPSGTLDLDRITHVRLIDVTGSIDPLMASRDSEGGIINDPYPTAFDAGGFDLDAVAVINQAPLGIEELKIAIQVYPSPVIDVLRVSSSNTPYFRLQDSQGKVLMEDQFNQTLELDFTALSSGFYLLVLSNDQFSVCKTVVKL